MGSLLNLLPSPNKSSLESRSSSYIVLIPVTGLDPVLQLGTPARHRSPNLFKWKLLYLFSVGQHLLDSILRSLAENKAARALGEGLCRFYCLWCSFGKGIPRGTFTGSHRKFTGLFCKDLAAVLIARGACCARKPERCAFVFTNVRCVGSLLSALMSLSFR